MITNRIKNLFAAVFPGTLTFVDKVTGRIATFDNDGTLWCEQPHYFQLIFAFQAK